MALTKKELVKIETKMRKLSKSLLKAMEEVEKIEIYLEAASVDLLNLSEELVDQAEDVEPRKRKGR